MAVRFELDTIYSNSLYHTFFVEYINKIENVETAFNLLHLLQHLNNSAIITISRQNTIERINPVAIRAMKSYCNVAIYLIFKP